MKRGDIVMIADPGAPALARKSRPALVIQDDAFLADHASVTVCLIASEPSGLLLFRVPVPANETTGLFRPSEVSVDKIQTVWRHRVGRHLGRVGDDIMTGVEQALRRWLAV